MAQDNEDNLKKLAQTELQTKQEPRQRTDKTRLGELLIGIGAGIGGRSPSQAIDLNRQRRVESDLLQRKKRLKDPQSEESRAAQDNEIAQAKQILATSPFGEGISEAAIESVIRGQSAESLEKSSPLDLVIKMKKEQLAQEKAAKTEKRLTAKEVALDERAKAQLDLQQKRLDLERQKFEREAAIPKVTKAQSKADEKFAVENETFNTEQRQAFLGSLGQLEDAVNILSEGGNITGPIRGVKFLGVGPGDKLANPNLATIKAAADNFSVKELKKTLGGQFSEAEGEALKALQFDPLLPEEENIIRLTILRSAAEKALQIRDLKAEYLDTHGTLKGFKQPDLGLRDLAKETRESFNLVKQKREQEEADEFLNLTPEDIDKMSIDELRAKGLL